MNNKTLLTLASVAAISALSYMWLFGEAQPQQSSKDVIADTVSVDEKHPYQQGVSKQEDKGATSNSLFAAESNDTESKHQNNVESQHVDIEAVDPSDFAVNEFGQINLRSIDKLLKVNDFHTVLDRMDLVADQKATEKSMEIQSFLAKSEALNEQSFRVSCAKDLCGIIMDNMDKAYFEQLGDDVLSDLKLGARIESHKEVAEGVVQWQLMFQRDPEMGSVVIEQNMSVMGSSGATLSAERVDLNTKSK